MMTFNEIYKKHYRTVFHVIKKIVKNEMDAEELASETMIRVHKNLATYKEELSKLSTWICNIATNAAIDFIRKKKLDTMSLDQINPNYGQERNKHGVDHLMIMKSSENNPEERLIQNEVRRTMYERFESLNQTDQLIASLHYFDGLSYEEVATEMNMPLGTIKAKIHKARVALMDAFPMEMRKLKTIER